MKREPSKQTELASWLFDALTSLGGHASVTEASKKVWEKHEQDFRAAGDLFYTWQYDLRWAAFQLRRGGVMRTAKESPSGIWELK